jgi:hypothetical protein
MAPYAIAFREGEAGVWQFDPASFDKLRVR